MKFMFFEVFKLAKNEIQPRLEIKLIKSTSVTFFLQKQKIELFFFKIRKSMCSFYKCRN